MEAERGDTIYVCMCFEYALEYGGRKMDGLLVASFISVTVYQLENIFILSFWSGKKKKKFLEG